ncbi:hypothetical protein SVIOM74S_07880 [Streptomyces violarus]
MRGPGRWWRRQSKPEKVETYTRWSFHSFAVVEFVTIGIMAVPVGVWPGAVLLLTVAVHVGVCFVTVSRALDWTRGRRPQPVRLLWTLAAVTSAVGLSAMGIADGGPDRESVDAAAGGTFGAVIVIGTGIIALGVRGRRRVFAIPAAFAAGSFVVAFTRGAPVGESLFASTMVLFGGGILAFTAVVSVWLLNIVYELDEARETRARLAVAEERLRFGRDLHDVMGRNLAVIALKSELAVQLAQRDRPEAVAQMVEVQRLAQESQREVREVVRGYREADLASELAGAQGVLTARRYRLQGGRGDGGGAARRGAVRPGVGGPGGRDERPAARGRTAVRGDGCGCLRGAWCCPWRTTGSPAGAGPPARPARPAPGRRAAGAAGGSRRDAGGRPARQGALPADGRSSGCRRVTPSRSESVAVARRGGHAVTAGRARAAAARRRRAPDPGALAALLSLEDDLLVVAEAATGPEALAMARAHEPDVAVLDLADARRRRCEGRHIPAHRTARLQGAHRHQPRAARASQTGAGGGVRGFVPKTVSAQRLAELIRTVHAGNRYVDPELAADAIAAGDSPLTAREAEVLELAADGAPVAEIAERAALSQGTVRNYLSSAVSKLGAENRHAAVRLARERGWV